MKTYRELCNEAEKIDPRDYSTTILKMSRKILPALEELKIEGLDVMDTFALFLATSVVADGVFLMDEYYIIEPSIYTFFGKKFDISTFTGALYSGKVIKKAQEGMDKIIDSLSDEYKEQIILVSLLICAGDGHISLKEKNYIKQLIK